MKYFVLSVPKPLIAKYKSLHVAVKSKSAFFVIVAIFTKNQILIK